MLARRFGGDSRGSIALNMAIAFPVLMLMVGGAVDYSNMLRQKASLQSVADSAALASARELRMAATNTSNIQNVASNVVAAGLADPAKISATSVVTNILSNGAAVQVNLGQDVPSMFGGLFSALPTRVNATSTARALGGAPICVIALNPSATRALNLNKNARLTGTNCAIYSDSTNRLGIGTKDSAIITAALICSAGGVQNSSNGMTPAPQEDCPSIPDPLAARIAPNVGACTQTNLVISGGTQSLNPGVYCGGLRITGGAVVTVNPGTFIIKDGPLSVDGNSSLTGTDIGFFLTGAGAGINFAGGANTVSLSAPISGLLAGLLFFEDRTVARGQSHNILADNARTLLGTIYLPRGKFYVASNAPVADQSAYTVVVADMIEMSEGPNLVLNSNYGTTNVPVPDGVGPAKSAVLQQ